MPFRQSNGDENGAITTQVIIIGAGLSGLQTAYDLQQAGISCIVLEARDRVGGKLYSLPVTSRPGIVELGGAWINDVNQPRVTRLAQELGCEFITQNTNGDVMIEGYGKFPFGTQPAIPEGDKIAYKRVLETVEDLCHKVNLVRPDQSLSEYGHMSMDDLASSLGGTNLVRKLVDIWTSAMLGMASKDVSAVYFLHYCRAGGGLLQMRSDAKGGGQNIRIRGGTQSLAEGLYKQLRPGTVRFSAAVEKVTQDLNEGCLVTTRKKESFRCQKVVSSVPSVLLKHITFSPPLSANKRWMISQNRLGFYAKVHLVYETTWWRGKNLCGQSQGFEGPVGLTRDTSSDADELYDLTCFLVGDRGRQWSQQTRDARIQDVLKHVDKIYGMKCPTPIEVIDYIWNDQEFSQGAPCPVVPSSCLQALGNDQWRPEGHIHFAGTEMSTVWKGYMEGALTAGATAAAEVISQLKPHLSAFKPSI